METQNRRQFIENLTLGVAAGGVAPMALRAQEREGRSAPVASARQGSGPDDPFGEVTPKPGYDVLYCFEFGSEFATNTPGFQPVSRVYRSPRYLWITENRDVMRGEESARLLRSFEQGAEGEFWVGMDDGDYEVTLIMADNEEAHGPFAIFVNDQPVASGVVTSPGNVLTRTFPVEASQGKLKVRLQAEAGKSFVLNRMIIQGPPGKAAQRMFAEAPLDCLPTVEEVLQEGNTDTRSTLRGYCDWLLDRRLSNGFLGDAARPGPRTHLYWYTSAYPIRTLLAGYDLFRIPAYLEAVTAILDKLVEEQLPNGAWQQVFRDKPTREMSGTEIDGILKHRWVNTADIGSIVTALAASCRYVSPARKAIYQEAAQRYCDPWASRWQLPAGAFSNGLEAGIAQTQAYSVATGTEAAAFAAVYAITGDPKYLQRARRAADFLLDNWQPDGRPICHQDPSANMGAKYVQPVTQFGDVFYYHDGILLVYEQCPDPAFRRKVRTIYGWHINGEQGLLQRLEGKPWWPLQDTWDNSKSAGMPQVLLAYRRMVRDTAVERAVGLMRKFLCTPKYAQRIGVMVNHPDLPWGGDSLQSWAGCAVAATGFAGMTIAEGIKPGVMYLR